jgi:hypothetical protein
MKFNFSKFWDGERNWLGYKATTLLFTSGIIRAFVENYWVFTEIPLAEEHDTTAEKTLYMLLQIAATVALYATVGFGVDHLRSIYKCLNERQRQGLINDDDEEQSRQVIHN